MGSGDDKGSPDLAKRRASARSWAARIARAVHSGAPDFFAASAGPVLSLCLLLSFERNLFRASLFEAFDMCSGASFCTGCNFGTHGEATIGQGFRGTIGCHVLSLSPKDMLTRRRETRRRVRPIVQHRPH